MCDCERKQTTEEMLALKFPGISKSWLAGICDMLKLFNGSGDMIAHWRPKQSVPRTQWTIIQPGETPDLK